MWYIYPWQNIPKVISTDAATGREHTEQKRKQIDRSEKNKEKREGEKPTVFSFLNSLG